MRNECSMPLVDLVDSELSVQPVTEALEAEEIEEKWL